MISHVADVLVIGAGAAGLRAAIAVDQLHARVLVVGKRPRNDAHMLMCQEAPQAIDELVSYGAAFARDPDGQVMLRYFGAHCYRRTAFAGADTGRLYVLSLGSQQGNRHVHWHLAPLPPGVPYAEQQLAALTMSRGILWIPAGEMACLAGEIRAALLAGA